MTCTADQFSSWARCYLSALAVIVLSQAELAAQFPQDGPTLSTAPSAMEGSLPSSNSEWDRTHEQLAPRDPVWLELKTETAVSVEAMTLTLDHARVMVLSNSRVLRLAALAIQEKRFVRSAAEKDFFPKILGSAWSFHFNDDLGTVVQTPGIINPATAVSVPIINQDASGFLVTAVQPITPLLKVRQAVNIASADVRIAETNIIKARRELSKGIEQLYFGLYTLQQGRKQAQSAVSSAEQMAKKSPSPLMNLVVIQAKQGLHTTDGSIAELTAQMNNLLEIPLNTQLMLEPPSPIAPLIGSEEDAIAFVMSSSPEIGEARANVSKAVAAHKLAKSDFVPTVAVMGFYAAQDSTKTIQEDFTGIGITASHTLFEWGKKKQVLCQRQTTLVLAHQNLRYTIETMRLKAITAYRKFVQTGQAAEDAQLVAKIYGEIPLPMDDPKILIEAIKERVAAQTAVATTQVAHRTAYAELMAVTGQIDYLE